VNRFMSATEFFFDLKGLAGGALSYDGFSLPRLPPDMVRTHPNYQGWMDVLTCERVWSCGALPFPQYPHCIMTSIEKGQREFFGNTQHWWRKMGALFAPSGQVKNFLNAALVAHRVPNGGYLAILGSRYAQGSGDWVKLLASWLDSQGRNMVIHCFDPNESPGVMDVGRVRVVATAQSVIREKLVGYDGVVDDIYVGGQGYKFDPAANAKYVSYKMYTSGEVEGTMYPVFLHPTESRYFNFSMDWREFPSVCRCQRCRIEGYLGIARYSDMVEPSPCRAHIPEVLSVSVQWNQLQVGQILQHLSPVDERARLVLKRLESFPAGNREQVERIVGYSPDEVPFKAVPTPTPWHGSYPRVVLRPGSITSKIGTLVAKDPPKGWTVTSSKDGWNYCDRPIDRVYLGVGRASVSWNGVTVESHRKIILRDSGVAMVASGVIKVKQWCFLHRCQDGCGLRTDFLGYPLCQCGHRHGSYDLRPFGVDCGNIPLLSYVDFARFIMPRRSYTREDDPVRSACILTKGDPTLMGKKLSHLATWMDLLRPPDYFYFVNRWYYYPWDVIRGWDYPMDVRQFCSRLEKMDLYCGPDFLAHPSSLAIRRGDRIYVV